MNINLPNHLIKEIIIDEAQEVIPHVKQEPSVSNVPALINNKVVKIRPQKQEKKK